MRLAFRISYKPLFLVSATLLAITACLVNVVITFSRSKITTDNVNCRGLS